jgi:hypothetical protein
VLESEDQVKRLQGLLAGKDDQLQKLTGRLDTAADYEDKVKKFFGENEDFHKKKGAELAKANTELADSEKRRMESLLADADSSAVREAVASLAIVAETVQSKTEQVGTRDLVMLGTGTSGQSKLQVLAAVNAGAVVVGPTGPGRAASGKPCPAPSGCSTTRSTRWSG